MNITLEQAVLLHYLLTYIKTKAVFDGLFYAIPGENLDEVVMSEDDIIILYTILYNLEEEYGKKVDGHIHPEP